MSSDEDEPPHLLSIDHPTKAAIGRITRREHCRCIAVRTQKGLPLVPDMHSDAQDERVPGWSLLGNLVERVGRMNAPVFEPSAEIAWEDWIRVVTLPTEIASLTRVQEIRLYGSHLRRLPPEVGRMTSLESLDVYTSYSLHWLPYEITRCAHLRDSRMSTRALYGNRNTRLPFPRLTRPLEALLPLTCSVCDRSFGNQSPSLYWTTQWIGTDHVPLLIHSCSRSCTDSVPTAPAGFFPRPHKGGGGVGMPGRNENLRLN
jgi:hypothetical protein